MKTCPRKKIVVNYRQLQVELPATGLYLLRVVEPLDLDHHAPVAGLPEHLDLPDVGPVAPAGGEEDRAVVDVEAVLATLDRPEEEFLGLALPSWSAVTLPAPLPELATLLWSKFVVGWTGCALQYGGC